MPLVCNRLQPKRLAPAGPGIGLDNLAKRYRLLWQREIQISAEKGMFCVRLPLHQPDNSHESTQSLRTKKAAVRNLKALLKEVRAPDGGHRCARQHNGERRLVRSESGAGSCLHGYSSGRRLLVRDLRTRPITAPIIFTTAYDEYALKAFKVNSVDYLLKPIGPADLRQALAKLEELHHAPESRDSLPELIRTLQKRGRYKTHFLIPSKGTSSCRWPSIRYSISASARVLPAPS